MAQTRYTSPIEKDRARRRRQAEAKAFRTSLYTGCCVCQLCGLDRCPNGLAFMGLNQRPYSVCPQCFDDDSIWYDENEHPRQFPLIPESRSGLFECLTCDQIHTTRQCPNKQKAS